MKKLLRALYMLGTVALSTVGLGQTVNTYAQQNTLLTIRENTPLYLEHFSVINQHNAQANVQLADHESHYSHSSHASHDSHYSHRSHYSGSD